MAKIKQEQPVLEDEQIEVIGAREHNLKNIDISIPKNKLVVFTGVSGSGKSSLAFDTIYNEGQRRYMESFSAYARQFIGDMERPDVDKIIGLSPVISIEQKTTGKNPRSTVGTITEIYDFLRLLFARIGEAYSYNTGKKMVKWSEEEILQNIIDRFRDQKITLLAPLVRGRKGHYRELFEDIRKRGFLKVRVDGEIKDITSKMQVDRYKIHDIDVVIDRLPVTDAMKVRLSQSVQQTLKTGKDLMFVQIESNAKKQVSSLQNETINSPSGVGGKVVQYSKQLMCEDTGISYEEPSPNAFSFNSPYGACPTCKGLGSVYTVSLDEVMPDKNKSIKDGGIVPLGEEREAYVYRNIANLAKKNKISLEKPIKELPGTALNYLLYGNENGITGDLDYTQPYDMYSGEFEGIIPMLNRWFNSSTSTDNMREWVEKFMELKTCSTCLGTRLKRESSWFKIDNENISQLSDKDLDKLFVWFDGVEKRLSNKQNLIAKDIIKEIRERLQFLLDVGLTYLTLNRSSRTLSGGEAQRIRLATQIGSQLQGITYILDEPSIGLHQRDNQRLIKALQNLRNIGNSVLVVEHDKDIMMAADHLVDIGPGAGKLGGMVVAAGTPKMVLKSGSDTALYLSGKKSIAIPLERRKGNGKTLELKGADGNNLKNVSVTFPLGKFIVVSGVSGSGKSTLINETLYPLLSQHCYHSRTAALKL